MKIEKASELENYSFFLSSKRAFYHCFADSGFKNKWTGFWAGNKKCLDYFALKCYDEWLSTENAKKVSYFGSHCEQEFTTKKGTIKQTVLVPKDSSTVAIQIEAKKEAWFELELAINMRWREENWHSREYTVKETSNGITIESTLGTLLLTIEKGQKSIKPESNYKEHSPAGEKQRCFLPAKIFLKGKKIVFSVSFFEKKPSAKKQSKSFDVLLKEKIAEHDTAINGAIDCNNKLLKNGFNWATIDLLLLETDKAYYSGLPWFLQYWARDLFWSLPAIIDLGEFEKAKKILKMFSDNASNGEIPNTIYNGKPEFLGIDTTPLWIIALAHYYRNSNDIVFLKNCKSQLVAALAFLRQRDIDNDGLLEHDEKQGETWMDSRKRGQNAVEVQALYIKAMEEAEFLFSVFGEEKKVNELKAKVFLSLDSFEKFKVFDSFLADRLLEKTPVSEQSCNVLVPIMFGTCNKKTAKHVLLEIESNVFDTKKGVRTLSKFEKNYSPTAYHAGMVWSLSTAWASAAEFFSNRPEKGEHFLHKLIEDLQQDALGCVGECWNPETSKLSGCALQLWGSAFIVRIIDEFLLGLRANAKQKTFFVSPRLPNSVNFIKRKKRLGNDWTVLTIKKTEKGLLANSSNKRIKIVLKQN